MARGVSGAALVWCHVFVFPCAASCCCPLSSSFVLSDHYPSFLCEPARNQNRNQMRDTYWGPNGLLYALYGLRMLCSTLLARRGQWLQGIRTKAAGLLPWWGARCADMLGGVDVWWVVFRDGDVEVGFREGEDGRAWHQWLDGDFAGCQQLSDFCMGIATCTCASF
jgi:hypothetical protein